MEITINEITTEQAQKPYSPVDGSTKKIAGGSPLAGISAATTMPGTDVNTSFCQEQPEEQEDDFEEIMREFNWRDNFAESDVLELPVT